jgi:3-hydroxyacyl-CoA dehydrogenase/3-hydroxy-2-methylbutyryl-CoA dehydrogenase
MKIENKTFVVTSGANGLGGAVVDSLIAHGANAVILDIKAEDAQEKCEKYGSKCFFPGETDISKEEPVQKALQQAVAKYGGIHGVVNCAGVATVNKTVTDNKPYPLDLYEFVIRVNLIGTFNVSRLASVFMSKNQPNEDGERGVIINTASVAAFDGQVGQIGYSASKGGVVSMTLPMARDLSPLGIRVMTIAPGLFETPMTSLMSDKVRASLIKQTEFPKRMGKAPEFAALCIHIIENVMLNGETIRLDGSIRMARM